MADATYYPYQSGVGEKLVPMGDGTYAPAVVAFAPTAPANYDYISMSYTGTNLTQVVYKVGGAGGTVVCTLNLTYDASNNLLTVARS